MAPRPGLLGYELNPPKLLDPGRQPARDASRALHAVLERVDRVRPYVDFLQLTDSVLGQPRLSPLLVVAEVRRRFGDGIRVRCNIRTRDHNLNSIIQLVASADTAGADGVLLVQGDRPRFGVGFNHGGAARVLAALRDAGFRDGRPKLYLTAPRSFSRSKLEEKIAARPDGLVTQPIGDLALVERFWEVLKPQGIELVVFVPIPSARNAEAAASLGFTWAVVDGDPVAYIGELRRRGVATLLSSPSSFADGFDVLRRLGARAVWART